MNCILIVALYLCAVSDGFRVKRQVTGGFWWENIGNAGNQPTNRQEEDAAKEEDQSISAKINPGDSEGSINSPSFQSCSVGNRVCVPYTHCSNGKIITDGFGILTTRSGAEIRQHSECPLYLEVCCEEPDTEEQIQKSDQVPITNPKCGQRNYNGIEANIGRLNSSYSQFGEFPWMAAILKKESIAGKEFKLYMCGASLISSNVVLTASHCIINHKAQNLIVRVGEWDTQLKYEPFKHQEQQAAKIIHHPQFNPSSLAYDFSLIILDQPFQYAPHVAPICLPNANDVFDGQMCYATGWGKEQFGEKGTYQNVLKNVDLEMVSHNNCEAALKLTRLGGYFELHDTFTCAGGKPGKDTCGGDGGSPLVCRKNDNSYYQTGIVAWGIGCGENDVPGVYADVRKAVDWINSEVAPYAV